MTNSWTRLQASLLPPLRFASRNDCAGAERLRGFEDLALRILGDAPDDGSLPKGFRDALARLATDFDAQKGASRRARVQSLIKLFEKAQRANPQDTSNLNTAGHPTATPAKPQQVKAQNTDVKQDINNLNTAGHPTASSIKTQNKTQRGSTLVPTKRTARIRPTSSLSRDDYFARSAATLKGIGPKKAAALDERGLGTLGALLSFLPRTYQDRSKAQQLAALVPGSQSIAMGTISASAQVGTGSRARWEILLEDSSGSLRLVFFRFRPQDMRGRYHLGTQITVLGEVSRRQGGLQMVHPRINPRAQETNAGIHPVYPEVRGLNAQEIGRAVQAAVEPLRARPIIDLLPLQVRQEAGVIELNEALLLLHSPPPHLNPPQMEALLARKSPAHFRLAFEELFVLQLALCLRKQNAQADPAPPLPAFTQATPSAAAPEKEAFVDAVDAMNDALLPFKLTGAQKRASQEILADLAKKAPMGRLLQGDVGAGKTAVAALACLQCVRQKHQAAIMAPTEILAEQHAATFQKWFTPLGFRVAQLTGSTRAKARRLLLAELQNRSIDILIGTHALVQDDVIFRRLGLCIIDEQHRFGVEQRAKLKAKGALLEPELLSEPKASEKRQTPHLLVMTATPIPRSLALTVYGELAVSILDELPPGRTPVVTRVLAPNDEEHAYVAIAEAITKGERAYIVYPLIEESETLDLEDATRGYEDLCERFGEEHVELLHGRMKSAEKDEIMQRFSEGKTSILVSTTVIEVGVDVPEATVMTIVNSERFGLSQLHQLRGRVGRSHRKSSCFLIIGQTGGGRDATRRLRIMEESSDGFRIAEEDLLIRGPGDFLGTRQSGLPTLQFASLAEHQKLIEKARQQALLFVKKDPTLSKKEHHSLRQLVMIRYQERLALAGSG